jgi:N-terminal acetyltransferase B complex catalytic subunit
VIGRRWHGRYYHGDGDEGNEDAYDMRKALSRDPEKKSMVPLGRDIEPYVAMLRT